MNLNQFAQEVRSLYPAASYLWILGGLWLATGTFVSVGMLRLFAPQLPMDRHWTEIARVRYPVFASLSVLPVIAIAVSFTLGRMSHELTLVPAWLLGLVKVLAVFFGYGLGIRVFFGKYGVSNSRRENDPSFLATVGSDLVLRWTHLLFAVLLAGLLPTPSVGTMVVLASFGGFVLWYARGGGVQLLGLIGWVRPLDSAREEALRALAMIPSDVLLYEIRSKNANAFALPSKHAVLMTTECLAVLDEPQLASVVKHELGHLRETTLFRSVRLAVAFFVSMSIAVTSLVMHAIGDLNGIGTVLAALVVVVLVSRWLLRDTEKHADEQGKEGDAKVYATALERIYEANGFPAVLRDKGLHDHLYDRILALGVTPSYPRPLPPPRAVVRFALATTLGVAVALSHRFYGEKNDAWALGVAGGTSYRIGNMAYTANAAGDSARAIALYGFQSTLDEAPDPLTNLAIVSGNAKRCVLSEQAIVAAKSRVKTWNPRLKNVFRGAVRSVWACNPSSQVAATMQAELGPNPAEFGFDPE